MQTRTKVLLALLFLPGPLAEVISTNMPLYNLAMLQAWIGLILIYGCGTLLVREAKVRWKAGWSIVFLAVAYGIFEEGLVTQAFFNPTWFGTGPYWMAMGVQWGWTILLLVFHASISILIPIYIISRLWPKWENKPVLGKFETVLALLGVTAGIALGMNFFAGPKSPTGFFAATELLAASFAVIALLALLAYRFRKNRFSLEKGLLPPMAIASVAFFFQGANTIVPPALASNGVPVGIGVAIQLLLVLAFALFAASQLLNKKTEKRHVVAFAFGSLLFWIFVSFLFGLDGRFDLLAVSPVALVLLVAWRRRALKI